MKTYAPHLHSVPPMSGAAAMVPWRSLYADYQTPGTIPLFGTTLRGVGPGGIPVAAPDAFAAPVTGVTHYTIDIQNFTDPGVCPSLGPTGLWGYHPAHPLGGAQPQRHLGGLIVGQTGKPIQITFRNKLNVHGQHLLPNDTTIMHCRSGSRSGRGPSAWRPRALGQ